MSPASLPLGHEAPGARTAQRRRHGHPAEEAQTLGPSGPGDVVVEIGGDMGGAILYTAQALEGLEVEVRQAGSGWDGAHVAVRERRLEAGVCWAALLAPLQSGTYEARLKGSPEQGTLRFEVRPSEVTSLHWQPT
jgi:hypothetical protein